MNLQVRVLLLVLGMLGASLSAPRMARANSGYSFWETIGIGIAVGTVLGASTLPFYDQPGSHAVNMAYGAGAGVATAIGIGIYRLFAGTPADSGDNAGIIDHDPRQPGPKFFARAVARDVNHLKLGSDRYANGASPPAYSVLPAHAHVWMPVVSVTW